jgi:menaquinol-cytochrome c reductase iron-sulfur subunit
MSDNYETPSEILKQRRRFLITAIYSLWAAITGTMMILASRYLLSGGIHGQDPWIQIGTVDRLPPDVPRRVSFKRTRTDGWNRITERTAAWVVKSSDGNIAAFTPACTHLGCEYHWEGPENRFVCPCHNSAFSAYGEVLRGPARRPLDRYETRMANNMLFIKQSAERVPDV